MGTKDQMSDLLLAAAAGKITPSIEVFEFPSVPGLVAQLKDDGITGRAVVKLPQ